MDSGDESSNGSCSMECDSDDGSTELQSESQEQMNSLPTGIFIWRSGRQWTTVEPQKYKIPASNILREKRGIARPVAGIQTAREAFDLMITPEMIALLVREINWRGSSIIRKWNDENPGKEQI